MRPLRLDLHGFTVFREPTTVDFTDADFFALVGPTGSGKSTILDAVCFALYGTVPRWADRRGIENALAPSTAQARVRLVFEAGGARFVATRVVRRDGKGKASTTHAGLEQLPPGFDLRAFDTAPAQRGEPLGTVLAGTPAEMEQAVVEAVGLPYEQFTTCVVLPQGEFARFLHAKPKDRQDILVNLLGLQVYARVGARAGLRQKQAEANAAATRSLLGELSDADDAALAAAEESLRAAQQLVAEVERELPALEQAKAAGASAQAELTQLERELGALLAIRAPAGLPGLAAEVEAAADAVAAAQAEIQTAEDHEEKAKAELAATGDRAELVRLRDAHTERANLAQRVKQLAAALAKATAEHDRRAAALAAAASTVDKAQAAVRAAQAGVEAAQTADRAATLRVHLVAGDPCPVCEQVVATVPAMPASPLLRAARERAAQADQELATATQAHAAADRALREADRAVAASQAQHQEAQTRLGALDQTLADAPDLSTVESRLTAIAGQEKAIAAARQAVLATRQAARGANDRLAQAQQRLRAAWQEYDRARDSVATLSPPPADRDQLVASWQALADWAAQCAAQRSTRRDEALAAAEQALTALTEVTQRLTELFGNAAPQQARGSRARAAAGFAGGSDPAAYRQAAAVAVERATAARDRVLERREQAQRLRDQLAGHERDAQVAKALAQHLRADQFERWLLTEALDALVQGASVILRDLSGGRYDLTHTKGEFAVVDHADAGLSRAVRTLSGGETFQASLALALALSQQLAGLSSASASLESILLDEGFGTLDPDTMDVVAATLENLASRGDRMVGVVTHVAALAERIPVRFEVRRDARGVATVERVMA